MLLKNPALLVLDEATANLDQHTEELFQRVLELKFASATIMCIAHRIETLRWCRTKMELGWGRVLSVCEIASETGSARARVAECAGGKS